MIFHPEATRDWHLFFNLQFITLEGQSPCQKYDSLPVLFLCFLDRKCFIYNLISTPSESRRVNIATHRDWCKWHQQLRLPASACTQNLNQTYKPESSRNSILIIFSANYTERSIRTNYLTAPSSAFIASSVNFWTSLYIYHIIVQASLSVRSYSADQGMTAP